MYHYRFAVFALFFLVHTAVYGQKRAKPNTEEIARAKALKEQYDKAEVVALNSLQEFTFSYNNKTNKVEVQELHKERLMCVDASHRMKVVKFYDAESSIDKAKVYYKDGSSAKIYVADDYYQTADFFYSDARVAHLNLTFSSIGFQYQVNFEKTYKDVKYFTNTYFGTHYPIAKKVIRYFVPRWLDLELKTFNFEGHDIKEEVEYDQKTDTDIYTFTANDVNRFSREENSPGPSHLYPHILVLAKSGMVNGKKINLFNSTQDLYNWYKSLVIEMKDDPDAIKEKALSLIEGEESDMDKVRKIYYWVQDNIRYIAFEDGIAGFKPEECQEVFTKRYGDCKGMANLTKQMLQIAGFDARLTWIGTKRIAYDYTLPSLAVDNHMICTVIIDGQKYYLDPTEKYNSFSDYAERIQGRPVLIEDGDAFLMEEVPVLTKSDNLERLQQTLQIDGTKLKGVASRQFNGESRAFFLYLLNNIQTNHKEDAIEYYINSGDKKFIVPQVTTSNINDRDQVFEISYELELDNFVSGFGDELYVDLDYDKEYAGSSFDDERETDYVLNYKKQLVTETVLELPDGFEISELPVGLKEVHPDFSFIITYEQKEKQLVYKKEISIDKAVILQEDFELWNACIEKLDAAYQEQIVLIKKP